MMNMVFAQKSFPSPPFPFCLFPSTAFDCSRTHLHECKMIQQMWLRRQSTEQTTLWKRNNIIQNKQTSLRSIIRNMASSPNEEHDLLLLCCQICIGCEHWWLLLFWSFREAKSRLGFNRALSPESPTDKRETVSNSVTSFSSNISFVLSLTFPPSRKCFFLSLLIAHLSITPVLAASSVFYFLLLLTSAHSVCLSSLDQYRTDIFIFLYISQAAKTI